MRNAVTTILTLLMLQGCFASLSVGNTLPVSKNGAIHTHVGVGSDGRVRIGASAGTMISP